MRGLGNLLQIFEFESLNQDKICPNVGEVHMVSYSYQQKTLTMNFHSQSFVGLCSAIRKSKRLMCMFFLRNVLNKDPLELGFFLHSPYLRILKFLSRPRSDTYRRNKLYYLRLKKISYSRAFF